MMRWRDRGHWGEPDPPRVSQPTEKPGRRAGSCFAGPLVMSMKSCVALVISVLLGAGCATGDADENETDSRESASTRGDDPDYNKDPTVLQWATLHTKQRVGIRREQAELWVASNGPGSGSCTINLESPIDDHRDQRWLDPADLVKISKVAVTRTTFWWEVVQGYDVKLDLVDVEADGKLTPADHHIVCTFRDKRPVAGQVRETLEQVYVYARNTSR
jgi:hypothetical protein